MHTLVAQIEVCLNSRPLTSVSPDPNDLNAIRPGQFLTEENLFKLPVGAAKFQNLAFIAILLITRNPIYSNIHSLWEAIGCFFSVLSTPKIYQRSRRVACKRLCLCENFPVVKKNSSLLLSHESLPERHRVESKT